MEHANKMNLKSHRQYVQEQSEKEEFSRELDQARAQARFAVELAMARERQGLTQEQAAQKAQIRQPMLARYERGQLPSAPTLLRLASALGVEIVFSSGQVTIRPMTTGSSGAPKSRSRTPKSDARKRTRTQSAPT